MPAWTPARGPSSISVASLSGRSPPPGAPQPASAGDSAIARWRAIRAPRHDPPAMAATTRGREEEIIEERGAAAYTAEFLGTFMLVFFICMIVILNSRDGLGFTDWAVIGLVHAFTLMLLVHSLGGASGAHFN